jgi:hypothetical protein
MLDLDPKYTLTGAGSCIATVTDGSLVDDAIIFRAQDNAFAAALPGYLAMCKALGCSDDHLKGVETLIDRVTVWRQEHPERCKVPD